MDVMDKLKILADSAKYDVSCSSSGSNRKNTKNGIGNAEPCGICHSFSADGRCISLLKILMTNNCIFDCKYCINRKSNTINRAIFSASELAELTINFYIRNYIEGLFLSSGIIKNPDYTMELMYDAIYLLRKKYKFNGYIHVKTIPGASQHLISKMGLMVDRMSINVELPSNDSLKLLAPSKEEKKIIPPMNYIKNQMRETKNFVRAGQTTQMIIGATKDTDYKIMALSEKLYDRLTLKRVYYSAYVPVSEDNLLPKLNEPPLIRENRLYQADWLLRYYGFKANDLLNEENPNFNYLIDPKADWALKNLGEFPKEINTSSYEELLKIPGIGVTGAKKIISARRYNTLYFLDLKKMNIVLKRAKYFITCNGKYFLDSELFNKNFITKSLILEEKIPTRSNNTQLSFFSEVNI